MSQADKHKATSRWLYAFSFLSWIKDCLASDFMSLHLFDGSLCVALAKGQVWLLGSLEQGRENGCWCSHSFFPDHVLAPYQ
ncbi:MAG: hypothetical protein ACRC23_06345, partial [Aeromonas jandaei]